MLYPLGSCPTQPLIKVADITLRNITQTGNYLPPGIIRCNVTEPCTGFVFDNVQYKGWWNLFGYGYITQNVIGTVTDSKPEPAFIVENTLPKDEHPKDLVSLM